MEEEIREVNESEVKENGREKEEEKKEIKGTDDVPVKQSKESKLEVKALPEEVKEQVEVKETVEKKEVIEEKPKKKPKRRKKKESVVDRYLTDRRAVESEPEPEEEEESKKEEKEKKSLWDSSWLPYVILFLAIFGIGFLFFRRGNQTSQQTEAKPITEYSDELIIY